VNRLAPAFYAPTLLTADLAFLKVGKLPEVVDRVEVANLHEPGADTLHDLTTSLETTSPVGLPLKQVAGVQGIRSELKHAAELSGRGRGPEGELLHERGILAFDQGSKLLFESGVLGVGRDEVSRFVVSLISLIFPNVDW